MPIYEYRCAGCGHEFELLQRISAPPPDTCESCGEGPLSKLISRTSFVLKGGGWYKDHYGLKSGGDSSGSESSSDSGSSSDSSGSSGSDSSSGSSASSSDSSGSSGSGSSGASVD